MQTRITVAKAEEAKMIATLAVQMWDSHTVDELELEFKEVIASQDSDCFICYKDNKVVAFAQFGLRHDYVEGTETSPVGYLEGIFVLEDYRHQGIAKELLLACEHWAKEKGCLEFASDCELENEESLKFHMAVGFSEANRIICFHKKLDIRIIFCLSQWSNTRGLLLMESIKHWNILFRNSRELRLSHPGEEHEGKYTMKYRSTIRRVKLFEGAFSIMRMEVIKVQFIDEKMKLVFPTMEYEVQATEFIAEFYQYNSEINGTGGIVPFLEKNDYEGWIKKVIADMDVANIDEKKVPALTYFYIRENDGKIVGMVNIRLDENELIRKEAGHIGYCIRPTERRKHYASQMLNDSLKVCHRLRIKNVLVSCDKDNIASANTIKSCGGILEDEFYSETFQEVLQRYVIADE